MEDRPAQDSTDALPPPDADVAMPAVNSAHLSRTERDDGVTEPRQNTQPRDGISRSHPAPLTVNDLLNVPDANQIQDDNMETASVASALSTQAFRENLHRDLCSALDAIKSAGSFASFLRTKADLIGGSEIIVDGVGKINIPLQEDQARQIIEKARQAPFGRGSDTVVDTSVRNTWELDPEQFRFTNTEQWTRSVDSLCADVGRRLGISSPIRAELYKMLVYEKGAMFKSHTDTEKIPGMFGTMVICLPSPHTGGDVVVRHKGKKTVFATSRAQPSVISWYSDVHHEVRPVTSGYRWVLTYNLAIPPEAERPSASFLRSRSEVKNLRHTLRRWLLDVKQRDEDRIRTHENPELVKVHEERFYMLDHEYTEDSLSNGLKALKPPDLARMQCLKSMADELGFDVYLAAVEKMESGEVEGSGYDDDDHWHREGYYDRYGNWNSTGSGSDDEDEDEDEDEDDAGPGRRSSSYHMMEEVVDSSISIKKLVDLKGQELRHSVDLDYDLLTDNLINDCVDPFEGTECEETDYEGYMGNSGPSATHWYRMTMAVLVPRCHVDRFLCSGVDGRASEALLKYYADQIDGTKNCELELKMLRILAMQTWQGPDAVKTINPTIAARVLSVVRRRQPPLFDEMLQWLRKRSDEATFVLLRALWGRNIVHFDQVSGFMMRFITDQPLRNQPGLLRKLFPGSEQTTRHERERDFISDLMEVVADECKTKEVTEDDGAAIVEMAREFCSFEFFEDSILPALELRARDGLPFALAAIQKLLDYSSTTTPNPFGGENVARSRQHYQRLAKLFVTSMSLKNLRGNITIQDTWGYDVSDLPQLSRNTYYPRSVQEEYEAWQREVAGLRLPRKNPSSVIAPSNLAKLFGTCLENQWDDLLLQLTFKILAEAETLPWYEYRPLWLPFLHRLIPVLEAAGVPLTTTRYQQITGAILDTFLQNYVKPKPPKENTTTGTARTVTTTNDRARKEWVRRAKVAQEELDKFPQEKLKLLLGGDGVDGGEKLARMKVMAPLRSRHGLPAVGLVTGSTSSSGSASASVTLPVAGVRRHREGEGGEGGGQQYSNARRRVS